GCGPDFVAQRLRVALNFLSQQGEQGLFERKDEGRCLRRRETLQGARAGNITKQLANRAPARAHDVVGGRRFEGADELTQKSLRLLLELVFLDLTRTQGAGGELALQPGGEQFGLMLLKQIGDAVGGTGDHADIQTWGRAFGYHPSDGRATGRPMLGKRDPDASVCCAGPSACVKWMTQRWRARRTRRAPPTEVTWPRRGGSARWPTASRAPPSDGVATWDEDRIWSRRTWTRRNLDEDRAWPRTEHAVMPRRTRRLWRRVACRLARRAP